MRKKTQETNQKLTQYYRWQFLRSNEKYCGEYDHFHQAYLEIRKDRPDDLRFFAEGKIKEFVRTFGINGIYDYHERKPHPDLRIYGQAEFPVEKGSVKSVFGDCLQENQHIYGDYLTEEVFFRKQDQKIICRKAFQVVINCDAEWGDIQRQLKIWYESVRNERHKRGVLKPKTNIARRDELDNYLLVYRLRAGGVSNIKVAKKLFPKAFSDNDPIKKRAAEDKASKYYDKAKELVAGDYRRITFS